MAEKKKKKKMSKKTKRIIKWISYGLLVAGTIVALVFNEQIFGEHAVFKENVSSNKVILYLYQNAIPAVIRTGEIIAGAITLNILLRFISAVSFPSNKLLTISRLILNLVKWVIYQTDRRKLNSKNPAIAKSSHHQQLPQLINISQKNFPAFAQIM